MIVSQTPLKCKDCDSNNDTMYSVHCTLYNVHCTMTMDNIYTID